MNLIKKLLNWKRTPPAAWKPEMETEEVPTMIIDDAPFRRYRLLRKMNGTGRQSDSSSFHMLASR